MKSGAASSKFKYSMIISAIGTVKGQIDSGGCACRWGGEEMLLIVHGDMEQACRTAESIRCTSRRGENKATVKE